MTTTGHPELTGHVRARDRHDAADLVLVEVLHLVGGENWDASLAARRLIGKHYRRRAMTEALRRLQSASTPLQGVGAERALEVLTLATAMTARKPVDCTD
jgi:hypothetical protein